MGETTPVEPRNPRADDRFETRVARLMAARLILCGAVLLAALAVQGIQGPDAESEPGAVYGLYATVAVAFLSTAVFGAMRGRLRSDRGFWCTQIGTDVAVVTGLVYFSGGSDSLFAFLYVLVVVFGAMLAERRGAFGAAVLSAGAYGAVLAAIQWGWVPDYAGAGEASGEMVIAAWCVHAGALLLVALLSSHLTGELHRADARLDQSRTRLHLLSSLHQRTVESLMSGLLTTDLEGRITSFNREAERISAWRVGEAVGRQIDEVLPGAWERVVIPAVEAEAAPEPGKTRERMPYRNRAGRALYLGLAGSVLRDEDDRRLGAVVIFQDVTRVVEMEAELRRSERLAATGRLAASIAHEVRNPLAAISGSVQMLVGAGDARGDEEKRLSEIVLREADRLNGLITDFLSYAHPRPPKTESVDLAGTVEDVTRMLANGGRSDVVVLADVAPGLCVQADPGQLRQVLWNLCANALQAMPEGGRLEIAGHPVGDCPQAAEDGSRNADPDATSRDGRVQIRVSDTGEGIDPEAVERIFDPFFTTKPEGTGLGLATVHRIVEAHGGSLRVESAVGRGTTFWIELPRATEEA